MASRAHGPVLRSVIAAVVGEFGLAMGGLLLLVEGSLLAGGFGAVDHVARQLGGTVAGAHGRGVLVLEGEARDGRIERHGEIPASGGFVGRKIGVAQAETAGVIDGVVQGLGLERKSGLRACRSHQTEGRQQGEGEVAK